MILLEDKQTPVLAEKLHPGDSKRSGKAVKVFRKNEKTLASVAVRGSPFFFFLNKVILGVYFHGSVSIVQSLVTSPAHRGSTTPSMNLHSQLTTKRMRTSHSLLNKNPFLSFFVCFQAKKITGTPESQCLES